MTENMVAKKLFKVTGLSVGALAAGMLANDVQVHADEVYKVKPGDTLSQIADDNNTTVDSLKELNGLSDANKIYVNQEIKMTSEAVESNTYVVKANDNLSQIALDYDTTVENLKAINNLNSDLIAVGQVLKVTGNSTNNTQETVPQQQNDSQNNSVSHSSNSQSSNNNDYTNTSNNTVSSTQNNTPVTNPNVTNTNTAEQAAKEWIAQKESGGSYTAQNGRYYGRYQLTDSYLNGDYSPANQERVANNYVTSRYGSWVNAKTFWQNNGWY